MWALSWRESRGDFEAENGQVTLRPTQRWNRPSFHVPSGNSYSVSTGCSASMTFWLRLPVDHLRAAIQIIVKAFRNLDLKPGFPAQRLLLKRH